MLLHMTSYLRGMSIPTRPSVTARRWPKRGSLARAKKCVSIGCLARASRVLCRRCSGLNTLARAASASDLRSVKAFVSPHATSGVRASGSADANARSCAVRCSLSPAASKWKLTMVSGGEKLATSACFCSGAALEYVRCQSGTRWSLGSVIAVRRRSDNRERSYTMARRGAAWWSATPKLGPSAEAMRVPAFGTCSCTHSAPILWSRWSRT
mmetsp:Transcript_56666/g.130141  ORF Transcript_56666/g.130141 Transcript_56666/m.130141 type:complete len:211 (+) Transcript_56666:377-1009(+)